MTMNQPVVNIVDLPDEILLHILKKLNSFDVLYSLIGVNEKLDRLACDTSFTRHVGPIKTKTNRTLDSTNNTILDRFCSEILPRIHDNVESLTLQGCALPRVLDATNYFRLHKLVIIELDLSMACHIFDKKSRFTFDWKQQISDLVLKISDKIVTKLHVELLRYIYHNIFYLFTNLKYLAFDGDDDIPTFPQALLAGFPSTTCCSSSITYLHIKMQNIDDCLYLLDGRLNQLHTLIIYLKFIHDPVLISRCPSKIIRRSWQTMANLNNPLRLKCFSFYVFHVTNEFEGIVVPLLRRMEHLEKLALSIRISRENSFIDGAYLFNYITSHMPYLHTFDFDIITDHVLFNEQQPKPTPDDIRHTFIERGYNADCYIDYEYSITGRCHVYSLPFHMERMSYITHSFPGDMFENVRIVHMKDTHHAFEHKFFAQISRAFPLLSRLMIDNINEQKEKYEEKFSIINFPHLLELSYIDSHIDYVEEFLSDLNTHLPSLNTIHVSYKHLLIVTENFTRSATRINCAKLKHISFSDKTALVHSKHYYQYFPSLL